MSQDISPISRSAGRASGSPVRSLPEAAALLATRSPQQSDSGDTGPDTIRKLFVEVTTECNLSCGMCMRHVWQDPIAHMRAETFERLLQQVRECGTQPTINFSGFGEPTVHPQLARFLQQVKEAGLPAELVTNGVTLDQPLAELLVDLQIERLVVSLDTAGTDGNGVFHNGPIDLVHENIRRVARLKITRQSMLPELAVEFVVSRRNVHELPAIRRVARSLGVSRIVVSNLVPYREELADEVLYQQWTTARRDRRPSFWDPTIQLPRLDPHSEARLALEELCNVGAHVQIGGQDVVGGSMHCRFIAEGCVAIVPDGSVSPCLPLSHNYQYFFRNQPRRMRACYFGNIHQRHLQEIWQDEAYRAFRRRVRRFEFSPCIDCGGCDLRETNEEDCFGNEFPCCGECLWAAGLVQCP